MCRTCVGVVAIAVACCHLLKHEPGVGVMRPLKSPFQAGVYKRGLMQVSSLCSPQSSALYLLGRGADVISAHSDVSGHSDSFILWVLCPFRDVFTNETDL